MQHETQRLAERYHLRAMELLDEALSARRRRDQQTATQYFHLAFEQEQRAANLMFVERDVEPTRSILFRSAGFLALDCGETREAERMAAAGLAGNPPADVAEQLRDLIERVNSQRHLELRGIDLLSSEVQLSLAGNAVSYGSVNQTVLARRVDSTEKLALRLAERRTGKPFEDRLSKSFRDQFNMFVSVPRAASYALTLRFGSGEAVLPGLDQRDDFIREMFDCLDAFRRDDEEELHRIIPDDTYFSNFVGLARIIEPDGANLNTVGFTTVQDGKEKTVRLSIWDEKPEQAKLRRVLNPVKNITPTDKQSVHTVIGVLRQADVRNRETSHVRIQTENQGDVLVAVPAGMMSDVVGQFWDTQVKVTGKRFRRVVKLEDIQPIEVSDGA